MPSIGSDLPDAIVIGPMKAGTTWIHDYLSWRGDVRLPQHVKETFYFDRFFDRGLNWYSRQFVTHIGHDKCVEVAPSLFHNLYSAARIKAELSGTSFIVATRDPVERAWSHYLHLRRKGYTKEPLVSAARDHPEILLGSRYDILLECWTKLLPDSDFLVLPLNCLKSNPEIYAGTLANFLGLREMPPPVEFYSARNAGGAVRNFMIAKAASSSARQLRKFGMHGLINRAKAAGLNRLMYHSSAPSAVNLQPTAEQRAWLVNNLSDVSGQSWQGREPFLIGCPR